MKKIELMKVLKKWANQGRYVFLKQDFAKFFPDEHKKTLSEGLRRCVKEGILQHVARGVYVNPEALGRDFYLLEHIVNVLRRGEYNYISLESMLSEYGAISQIPIDRLTVMTTGRRGTYETPYGVIEFTHTARSREDILNNTVTTKDRPLRMATLQTAWRDLKRVGRNVHLVDLKEVKNGNT